MEERNQVSTPAEEEVIVGGMVSEAVNRGMDFLPKPKEAEFDEKLYAAWSEHMVRGFEQNSVMFEKILGSLMKPYWITVVLYVALFIVGVGGFVAAVFFSVTHGITYGLLFGGLTVGAFLTFFISRPLRTLEQNLLFITWLGVIYNTYWSRLMYANKMGKIQRDLDAIEDNTISELNKLINKQEKLSRHRSAKQAEDS